MLLLVRNHDGVLDRGSCGLVNGLMLDVRRRDGQCAETGPVTAALSWAWLIPVLLAGGLGAMVYIVPSTISEEKRRPMYAWTYVLYMGVRAVLGSVYAFIVYSATLAQVLPFTIPADPTAAVCFLVRAQLRIRLFGPALRSSAERPDHGREELLEEEGRRRRRNMTPERRMIVVIGQVASGKTTVARELGRRLAGRVSGIEQLRAAGSDTSPSGVAASLRLSRVPGPSFTSVPEPTRISKRPCSRSKPAGSCPSCAAGH